MTSQPGTMTRGAACAGFEASRKELLRALDGLTPEQMAGSSIDGWSIKDQLAHIAYWDELSAQDFRRVARGHAPALMYHSPDRTDELNDLIMSMRRNFSLDQVLAELHSARAELIASVEALPDEVFAAGFVPVYLGICGRHDEEHSELIDAWRKEAGV